MGRRDMGGAAGAPSNDRTPIDPATWRRDPLRFFEDVLVLEDGRSYGGSLDQWQREDFEAAFAHPEKHVWWERPRGHSKSADAAALALHHLLSGQGRRAYVGAVDKDQAALIADTINGFVMRSELLRASLQLSRFRVTAPSTGSTLQVLPADAPSAWGLRPSLIVLDELSSWSGHGAEEFFQALISSIGKTQGARAVIATTAHWDRHSLCWTLRSQVEQDPAWLFMRRGQCASWVSEGFLNEQRRLLPSHVYRMLHLNEWSEPGGAFLTWEEVDSIFRDEVTDVSGHCFLGLDIGTSNDRTSIVVVRAGGSPLNLRAIAIETAQGTPDDRVQLMEVEARVVELAARFRVRRICLDPWQGLHLSERLRQRGLAVTEHPFTQASRARLYDDLLQLVRQRRLTSIENKVLRAELEGLRWVERMGLLRVDHRAGQHDDAIVALALASSVALSSESRAGGPISAMRVGGSNWRPSFAQRGTNGWWS